VLRAIGPIFFIIILCRVNLSAIANVLVKIKPGYLLISAMLNAVLFILKAQRWRILLRMQRIKYPFGLSLRAVMGAFYISLITPGRVGDLVRVLYVREHLNISWGKAASSLIFDHLCDILLFVMIVLTGVYMLSLNTLNLQVGCILVFAAIALTFFLVLSSTRNRIVKWMAKHNMFSKRAASIQLTIEDFLQGLKDFFQARLIFVGALTIVINAVLFVAGYLLARSLDLPLSFSFIAYAMAACTLVSLLPISFSGVGVRDSVLILLFAKEGLGADLAVSFSILLLVVLNVFSGLFGLIAWIIHPVQWKRTLNTDDGPHRLLDV
jgi:uncharacterized protein (TIRG00374 family)